MKKVQAVVRRTDREQLAEALRDLGVLHITPVNPVDAIAEADITQSLDSVRRAVQILSAVETVELASYITAEKAVEETLTVERSLAEYDSRLNSLFRQLEQQVVWGNITLDDFETLNSAGASPQFYLMSKNIANQVQAEFAEIIQDSGGMVVVAVIDRSGDAQIPEAAELIPLPARDNPSIRAEASEVEAARRETSRRLNELAGFLPEMQLLLNDLEEKSQFSVAINGALNEDDFFAIEGWMPADLCETLSGGLDSRGVAAGIRITDPGEEDGGRGRAYWWTNPVLANGRLYLRSDKGSLVCVDLRG